MTALSTITLPLHRIIPFSNVEGAGNRISIFLQGCKLNCLYCHNPETIPRYSADSKRVSLRYLYDQVQDSMPFIRGVTISGGEPTIHHRKLVPLFQALRQLGLSCYLDSSGFFEFEPMQELIALTDKFLFDLKGSGLGLQALCFERKNQSGKVPDSLITTQRMKSANLTRNLDNLRRLLALGKIEEVRLVVMLDFVDSYELIEQTATLLKGHPEVIFKLIRVHAKGTRDPDGITAYIPDIGYMNQLEQYARKCGINKVITVC
ncbi:4Fe-4S cluster-binding domain-containing protein [Pasteurellaceae bacterium USgator11]|nr:4Fe-4S cluster-binding domain-containing protein [Pasteurellaceae bacterium UScroc12]TNG97682.1 4Fe-4S cluster-binding domain-containing protein [Pasteurellaceae bacterium USgator41]TNH01539.1 4Fe-4S cluster-binding domain-containing protein [Pasteurellaceae bacterium UScroc31]TNH02643.1 4Fe-4S cluster-binding domain-containing protein [Pasteurellaceae bacterium USgator11]